MPFGGLVRSLHYWSAQLLVGAIGVHLLRVIFTGAYASPRRFNHLLGMSLFVGAVLLNFTGYMLRWDQGIQWALVVGTNLLKTVPLIGNALYLLAVGGSELGAATLIRFYAWHIFGLTLPFAVVLASGTCSAFAATAASLCPRLPCGRIMRASRAMSLCAARCSQRCSSARCCWSWPCCGPRRVATPILDMTDLTSDALAPWFFLWVQQTLKWGDPFVLGVLMPLVILAILSALPYLAGSIAPAELGRWFPRSGRTVQIVVGLTVLALTLLTVLALIPAS